MKSFTVSYPTKRALIDALLDADMLDVQEGALSAKPGVMFSYIGEAADPDAPAPKSEADQPVMLPGVHCMLAADDDTELRKQFRGRIRAGKPLRVLLGE